MPKIVYCALAASLCLGGCGKTEHKPATQIIVAVTSDLAPAIELSRIEIKLGKRDGSGVATAKSYAVVTDSPKSGQIVLPLSFAIGKNRESSFLLVVTGYGPLSSGGEEEALVTQKMIAEFQEDKTLLLKVFLGRVCLKRNCADDDICYTIHAAGVEAGDCGPLQDYGSKDLPEVDVGDLPDLSEPPEGAVVRDGGSVEDSGVDDASFDAAADTGVSKDSGSDAKDAGSLKDTGSPKDSGNDSAPIVGCTPTPADTAVGIFVSPAGSTAANCGSAASPCSTIGQGIARALSTSRSFIYLDTGKYAESVTLAAGLTLLGGWDNIGGSWTRQCKDTRAQSARIASPTSVGILAQYDGTAALDTLSIETKPTASAGESLYGVFARGATTVLTLNDVSVTTYKGGDGAKGDPGVTPPAPSGTCTTADDGANGTPDGTVGEGAPAGQFNSDGYQPADGQQGDDGVVGHNGAEGSQNCYSCTNGTSCASATLCRIGGHCCTGTVLTGTQSCSIKGAPGCGGLPSSGGQGGRGGGASIALFVWDAIVVIKDGRLTAADGGNGGSGGDTVTGGQGGVGGAGSHAPDTTACAYACTYGIIVISGSPPLITEGCRNETSALGQPGTNGGNGGNGSAGGSGGGGAGGFSYAVYQGGSAEVTIMDTVLVHGNAGTSPSNGAAGLAADVGP